MKKGREEQERRRNETAKLRTKQGKYVTDGQRARNKWNMKR